MKNIYVLCGISGSGKSFYAMNTLDVNQNENTIYLNADSIRAELCSDASIQGDGNKVFGILFARLKTALADDTIEKIVVDNTALRYSDRAKYYETVRLNCKAKYEITLVYFIPNLNVALEQNEQRERKVPSNVIIRQFKTIEKPHIWELDNINVLMLECGKQISQG